MRAQVPASLLECGEDHQIRDRKRRNRENRNELVLALLSLILLFGVVYFAELDDNYRTSTRITAAIQRVLGTPKARASK